MRLHFGTFPEVYSRLELWILSDELLDRCSPVFSSQFGIVQDPLDCAY